MKSLSKDTLRMMINQDTEMTRTNLAEELGISNYQLTEYLNKIVGKDYNSFINEYKIDEAKKMLIKDPDASIISIAYTVGFQSKSAFNNAFLKTTGQIPTEYRKKAKNN